jgi:hypothetical protein
MKNPYFSSRPGSVENAADKTVDEILTETGLNTGNLMFFSASRRVVKHEKPSGSMGFDPNYVRENHDGIVIPAANWLTGRRDLGGLAALIERANLPTVILGLGAQSFDSAIPELLPGTQRFLKVVSERCKNLSVRGAFTADVIASAGVTNVTVTGCPSLLWRIDGPPQIDKKSGPISKVSISGTRYDDEPNMFSAKAKSHIGLVMMRLAMEKGYDYVAQTERLDMQFARGELTAETAPDELDYLAQVYGSEDKGAVVDYLKSNLKIFTDVGTWTDYASTMDFAIGTRLHGVIATLLGGTPAMLVTHDTRTVEMANQAGIPNVSARKLLKEGVDVQQLYDDASFDAFNRKQVHYYNRFVRFFQGNNVETNLGPEIPVD